jgi:hypothetical protein
VSGSRHTTRGIRCRIPCALEVEERSVQGLVIDMWDGGLYVETNTFIGRVSEVTVHTRETDDRPEMWLKARAVKIDRVPPRLAGVVSGGVELEVTDASREFEYVAKGEEIPDPEPGNRFRFKLVEKGGCSYRTVIEEAEDEEEARKRVEDSLGEDWEILEVETL